MRRAFVEARGVLAFSLAAACALACGDDDVHEPQQRSPEAPPSSRERHDEPRGMRDDGGMMRGRGMMRDMPDWMMSSRMRMDRGMMREMRTIRELLRNHDAIERQVEDVPRGIRSTTTSSDPRVATLIRRHVHQMKQRMEQGRPIRQMDPVFRELFRHHEAIDMQLEDVPGGVRVIETSDDPQVTLLIRQHAHRAVSEFVEQGMQRAMQPTPLPEGYEATQSR